MTSRSHRKVHPPKPLELILPATSANLGPAFDAAALALELFLKVHAKPAKEFSISAKGRNADICQQLENNLILNTYREVLQAEGKPVSCHLRFASTTRRQSARDVVLPHQPVWRESLWPFISAD